jgi:hypothetical protein
MGRGDLQPSASVKKKKGHEGIIVEFKRGKWKLVGRSLRKANRSVDRNALDWGPQEKEQRNIKKLERER